MAAHAVPEADVPFEDMLGLGKNLPSLTELFNKSKSAGAQAGVMAREFTQPGQRPKVKPPAGIQQPGAAGVQPVLTQPQPGVAPRPGAPAAIPPPAAGQPVSEIPAMPYLQTPVTARATRLNAQGAQGGVALAPAAPPPPPPGAPVGIAPPAPPPGDANPEPTQGDLDRQALVDAGLREDAFNEKAVADPYLKSLPPEERDRLGGILVDTYNASISSGKSPDEARAAAKQAFDAATKAGRDEWLGVSNDARNWVEHSFARNRPQNGNVASQRDATIKSVTEKYGPEAGKAFSEGFDKAYHNGSSGEEAAAAGALAIQAHIRSSQSKNAETQNADAVTASADAKTKAVTEFKAYADADRMYEEMLPKLDREEQAQRRKIVAAVAAGQISPQAVSDFDAQVADQHAALRANLRQYMLEYGLKEQAAATAKSQWQQDFELRTTALADQLKLTALQREQLRKNMEDPSFMAQLAAILGGVAGGVGSGVGYGVGAKVAQNLFTE